MGLPLARDSPNTFNSYNNYPQTELTKAEKNLSQIEYDKWLRYVKEIKSSCSWSYRSEL